jgi:hypothetical protein
MSSASSRRRHWVGASTSHEEEALTRADMRAVEALCELALTARRLGWTIRVVDPSPDLRDLIVFAGLEDVLLGDAPDDGAR